MTAQEGHTPSPGDQAVPVARFSPSNGKTRKTMSEAKKAEEAKNRGGTSMLGLTAAALHR
ncbi:MAG: hypothetical protein MZV49_14855 [Rhodopseudomonas palustris]|nr:hypothetical protein [Rhodopseudomonas palustris]